MADEISTTVPSRKPPRWWPLLVVCALEIMLLTLIWLGPAVHRQERVTKTGGVIVLGILLTIVWLLVLSRLPWRVRWTAALLFISAVGFGCLLFRFQGVSGDLIPIFAPRWSSARKASIVRAPATRRRLPDSFSGFPQFLGPTRNGIVAGPALAVDWSSHAPELLWRIPVGEGYAGFAIDAARAICLEQRDANEAIVCYDVLTGATLWIDEATARYDNPIGGIGPRTTPTISGQRVFALGATGRLRCLDLATGKPLWQRDILSGHKAPDWGVAGSPLVLDELVVVHPGGAGHSLAAYRADTGEPVWAGGDARAGYSSPQLVTLLGEPQFLIFNDGGVAGHAKVDGHLLWSYPWTHAAQHISDPRVVASNRFVVSGGYGSGTDLVELSHDEQGIWKAARVWHSQRLKSKFGSLVAHDGFLYGLDDGRLTCLDLETGEPRWKGERVGHGQLLLARDLLLVTAEDGNVLLFEARPDSAHELGRFAALSGKMWNPPALAPPLLIVRTEHEAACYWLPLANESR
jgi:outer membrane protein assembly factor BamB